jgi:large subunit ribosomal protein L17
MRHRRRVKRIGRTESHKKAMLENLVGSLFKHERVRTTLLKAKEAQRLAEHLITLGKRGDLSSRRAAIASLQDRDLTAKLFSDIAPRFSNRNGGYTRVVHAIQRPGDGARMAVFELTELRITRKVARERGKEKEERVSRRSQEPKDIELVREEPSSVKEKPAEAPPKEEKPKPGFLGGLRKLFGRGKPDKE